MVEVDAGIGRRQRLASPRYDPAEVGASLPYRALAGNWVHGSRLLERPPGLNTQRCPKEQQQCPSG